GGVRAWAVGRGRGGASARPRAFTGPFAHGLGQAPHDHAVPDVPGDPRQLPCAVGDACGELGDGIGHAVAPRQGSERYSLTAAKRNCSAVADLSPGTAGGPRPPPPSLAAKSCRLAAATSTGALGAVSPTPGPCSFGRAM